MPLRDRIASPGGFVYPLKSHEGHFYLRPCANDVIDIVTFLEHYLYHNSYLTPITSLFSISYILSNLGTWPRGFDPYYRWLKRVFATKQWVIFDAINLTRHNVELNYPLIFSFFYFWSTATNTFVFPFSFMTITLQDVATILGFPIVDDEIPSLFDQPFVDLRCSFNRSTNGYPYFITTHVKKINIIYDVEHKTFLLF